MEFCHEGLAFWTGGSVFLSISMFLVPQDHFHSKVLLSPNQHHTPIPWQDTRPQKWHDLHTHDGSFLSRLWVLLSWKLLQMWSWNWSHRKTSVFSFSFQHTLSFSNLTHQIMARGSLRWPSNTVGGQKRMVTGITAYLLLDNSLLTSTKGPAQERI